MMNNTTNSKQPERLIPTGNPDTEDRHRRLMAMFHGSIVHCLWNPLCHHNKQGISSTWWWRNSDINDHSMTLSDGRGRPLSIPYQCNGCDWKIHSCFTGSLRCLLGFYRCQTDRKGSVRRAITDKEFIIVYVSICVFVYLFIWFEVSYVFICMDFLIELFVYIYTCVQICSKNHRVQILIAVPDFSLRASFFQAVH